MLWFLQVCGVVRGCAAVALGWMCHWSVARYASCPPLCDPSFPLRCHSFESMFGFFVSLFVISSTANLVSPGLAMVHNRIASAEPTTIAQAHHPRRQLGERQDTDHATTCGYLDGNPQSSRTADPGYDCRVDTARGLWGFCPLSVFSASDCGLAGFCVDKHSCTAGCGRLYGQVDVTTFSWLATQLQCTKWTTLIKGLQ